jgi:hypothetical protein
VGQKVVHDIRRIIFQSDEFEKAEQFLIRFNAFTDSAIDVVKPQRFMAESVILLRHLAAFNTGWNNLYGL